MQVDQELQKASENSTQNNESGSVSPQNNTAIQNNFHFRSKMDINAIGDLNQINPDLADRAMAIYEAELQHTRETDNRILLLEERNKTLEETEAPFIRKFSFRGQLYAFLISLSGLGVAVYFGSIGMAGPAIVAMTITVGTLAVQFLGKK